MSLLTDSGTALGLTALHGALTNPNYRGMILPPDTIQLGGTTDSAGIKFFPAQLNGVAQALVSRPPPGIVHIPCRNHATNLVFTHPLLVAVRSARIELPNTVVDDLRSRKGLEIMDRKRPALVKMRWVYALDVPDIGMT
jgi:hypothetical protein